MRKKPCVDEKLAILFSLTFKIQYKAYFQLPLNKIRVGWSMEVYKNAPIRLKLTSNFENGRSQVVAQGGFHCIGLCAILERTCHE